MTGVGEDVRDRDSVCSALRRFTRVSPVDCDTHLHLHDLGPIWRHNAMTLESLHEIAMLIRLQMSCAVKISRIICNESFISGFYV